MTIRALILAVMLAFGFAGGTSAQVGMQTQVISDLNLRSGPGTQFGVLRVVPRGSWVQLLGCAAGWQWCNVRYAGTPGWVSASYLSPRPGASAPPVPLPTPVPPPPFPGPVFPGPGFPGPGPGFPGPGPIFPGPGPIFPGPGPGPGPVFPGQINVVGTLTTQGAECPTLRGDNGQIYSLVGGTQGFRPGDRVRVRGRVAQMSFCMQGTAVEVRSITPAR